MSASGTDCDRFPAAAVPEPPLSKWVFTGRSRCCQMIRWSSAPSIEALVRNPQEAYICSLSMSGLHRTDLDYRL